MKKLALVFLLLAGCSNAAATRDTLRKSGYSDIETTGYSFFACSDSDTFSTGFVARNPAGNLVSGTVCCGLLKSCTVRF